MVAEQGRLLCPLCNHPASKEPLLVHRRDYYQCEVCQLIYVPPWQHISPEEEKECYDYHENDSGDPHYRKFLSRLFQPMRSNLEPGMCGLDFGSGPGPTLSVMFEEVGFEMDIYDPFYAPDKSYRERQYDFISSSEVFEHLHSPGSVITELWNCLKPSGLLGVMTTFVTPEIQLKSWHYMTDPTHVCFYSKETFCWIADKLQAQVDFPTANVALLYKSPPAS